MNKATGSTNTVGLARLLTESEIFQSFHTEIFFQRTWMAMTYAIAEVVCFCDWNAPKKGPLRILDLGSGTGSSGLAVMRFLREFGITNPIELHAWDYSAKSAAYLRNLHRTCIENWPGSHLETKKVDLQNPLFQFEKSPSWDLVLAGFSLNEILLGFEIDEQVHWLDQVSRLIKQNGFLILCEPAKSEICNSLQKMSVYLARKSKNLFLRAPYFNGLPCPFASGTNRFYSHEVRKSSPPKSVEEINRPLGLQIREVKFGLSILSHRSPNLQPRGPSFFRLISPVSKRKGIISFFGLGSDGMEYLYEFEKKNLTMEEMEELISLERGDLLKADIKEHQKGKRTIRLFTPKALTILFVPRIRRDI